MSDLTEQLKHDTRAYLAQLEAAGELAVVERQVDWNLEMGAIARRSYEVGGRAALFTDVKDARPGFSALGAPIGVSRLTGQKLARLAIALGLPAAASAEEIIDTLVDARSRPLLEPMVENSGPCKELVWRGSEVDLTQLPIPLLHEGDGGRYLNTLGIVITRTPDRRWTSWAVARLMLLDERRATYGITPFQHTGRVLKEWRSQGEDMPVAIAFGVPTAALFAASMPLPEDVNEGAYASALLGEPVAVVPCESIDLEVPAVSEIVLEGHISLEDHGLEGPFGDYSGYVSPAHPAPQPIYTVDVMTAREGAIYPFSCSGEPADETHTIWGVATAAESVHVLRSNGIPVTTGWCPFAAGNGWLVVTVPDHWRESERDADVFCRRIGEIIFPSKLSITLNTIIVCEDDVDPSHLAELVWAIDGRRNSTITFPSKFGFAFSPYIRPDFINYPMGWMAKAEVWNLLPPPGVTRPARTRFSENYPRHLREHVLRHWVQDGLSHQVDD